MNEAKSVLCGFVLMQTVSGIDFKRVNDNWEGIHCCLREGHEGDHMLYLSDLYGQRMGYEAPIHLDILNDLRR